MNKKLKHQILGILLFIIVNYGPITAINMIYGDDDEIEEQAIESSDDKPFINMTLKNNGSLLNQLDNLQQLLCKMNIEHGAPELNGPECLP